MKTQTKHKKICDCGFPQSHPKPHTHSLPDTKHTATPYEYDNLGRIDFCRNDESAPNIRHITGDNPRRAGAKYTFASVECFTSKEAEATAEFIVKACNSHEELVEENKRLKEELNGYKNKISK